MPIASVARELLVRYLDTWAPVALHARAATFAHAWAGPADVATAEAAVGVFAEFADRLRGRRLTVVLIAPDTAEVARRAEAVQAEAGTPAALAVHTVAGSVADRLPAALTAAQAAGHPLLVGVDADDPPRVPASTGRPTELFLLTAAGAWSALRERLHEDGFPLTAGVELVAGKGPARLLVFATTSVKSLEVFKSELWAVDEYAGVSYRDPTDPAARLLDISLQPPPGPLRRELLAYLADKGATSVTDLRRYALTDTVYRAADVPAVLTALLGSGAVRRDPPAGRLGGDVLISPA
jgi:hypothetical protein